RIFNVVDDTPAPRAEILAWLSERLGIPLSNSAPSPKARRGRSNKRVSNAKLRALGWVPAYPSYREGFGRSVLPALENCGACLRLRSKYIQPTSTNCGPRLPGARPQSASPAHAFDVLRKANESRLRSAFPAR